MSDRKYAAMAVNILLWLMALYAAFSVGEWWGIRQARKQVERVCHAWMAAHKEGLK